MKFTPTKARFLAGFWKANKGDVVRGVIREAWEGEYGMTLAVLLSQPVVVEQKNRETAELSDYEAQSGDEIGVNVKAGLRGLDKYVGHEVTIKYLGKSPQQIGSRTVETHQYDVDVSDKPVDLADVRKNGGAPKKSARKSATA
jgi:hypothetical protein